MGKNVFITNTVDPFTGEVLDTSITTSHTNKETEPDYIKLYTSDISKLLGVSDCYSDILYQILKATTYDNTVVLNADRKETISRDTGFAIKTIEKSITHYLESGILCRKNRGTYLVNPHLFGKGKWDSVRKIRLTVTYDADGRLIQMEKQSKNDLTPNLDFENESYS